jgi:transcriptional regulator GlxA family with amidase domain
LLPAAAPAIIPGMPARRIVIVAFPDVQSLDVTGPAEVFGAAARLGHAEYAVAAVASGGESVSTVAGLTLLPRPLSAARGRIDTLIVAGGPGTAAAAGDARLIDWIRGAAGRSRRVASVCTGAFLLAVAGLLDGRRATTHWASCDHLQRLHPEIEVDPDPIFVRDGDVWTSAGVTAGIDLALALVEDDAGADAARDVARWLVLFLQRPGGQAQFSAQLARPVAERDPLRELQAWLPEHLDADLSVAALAERACMSPRNFARAFRREVGTTPAAYVAELRLERARAELESGAAPVEEVARRCGFGTVETLRRTFQRRLRVAPADYRARFRSPTTRGGSAHGRRHSAV